MQLTVEIDDETCAGIEAIVKSEQANISGVAYKISVSRSLPFTSEDVYRAEEELYLEGKA